MHKTLTSLILLLLFVSSCHKEQDLNYNYYYSPPQEEIQEPEILVFEDGFNPPFHRNITETQILLFQLMTTIAREAFLQPQLYFFNGSPSVEVRTDCPSPTVSGATYPKTLNLDFGTGCTNAGTSYAGDFDIIFSGPIGDPSTTITVQPLANLQVGACTFSSTGPITLTQNTTGGGLICYDYSLGGSIAADDGTVTTTVPSGATGNFKLMEEVGDDPNNPADFIDNMFNFSLEDIPVTCSNNATGASMTFCTGTGDENIELQPLTSTCPTGGILSINNDDGTCASPTSNCNSTQYEFTGGGNYESVQVLELLSYEGTFTVGSNEGAASGCTSTNIGVSETNTTAANQSLQISGNPPNWVGPTTASPGMLNVGQVIVGNPTQPWINEIDYDQPSDDNSEFFEIAGPAGLDLSDYKLLLYNGNTYSSAVTYGASPIALSGIIPDEGGGFGAIQFPTASNGIQNGPRDGVALVSCVDDTISFCN